MKKQRKTGTNLLPEDVLLQILLRLTVKSIVKFRCISKSWCALLKSSYFIDTHLKFSHGRKEQNFITEGFCGHSGKGPVISVISVDESLSVLIPDFVELGVKRSSYFNHLIFVGSCNGIACISLNFDIILLSPAIHEFRILPPFRQDKKRSNSVLGFGFDPVSNDYKVISLISEYHDGVHCKARIYNLSTDTWRLKDDVLPRTDPDLDGFTLFFNGRVHWWVMFGQNILTMDISTEEVQELPMYKEIESVINYRNGRRLHVVQDCLAVISYDNYYPNPYTIHIWLMKEYGVSNSWSKCYTVGPLSGGIHHLSTIWDNQHLLLRGTSLRSSEKHYRPHFKLVVWDILKNELVHEYITFKDCHSAVIRLSSWETWLG